jgi:hypothetical protein
MMYGIQTSNFTTDVWNGTKAKYTQEQLDDDLTQMALPQPLNPSALSNIPNGNRDTEWLRVEVCREFMRGSCKRTDNDCKFAHPQHKGINVDNGKVVACFDSLKGKCHRDYCKYFHAPTHIKSQLEINGRNAQMMRKNLQSSAPMMVSPFQKAEIGVFQPTTLQPVMSVQPTLMLVNNPADQTGQVQSAAVNRIRPDRLEICRDFMRANCERGNDLCKYAHPPIEQLTVGDQNMIDTTDNTVIVCMDAVKGRCSRQTCKYFHPPAHLITEIKHRQSLISQQTEIRNMTSATGFENKPAGVKFEQTYKYDFAHQTTQNRRPSMGYDSRGPPTSPSPGPVYPQSSMATVPLVYNAVNLNASYQTLFNANNIVQGSMVQGQAQNWSQQQTTQAINPMTMTIGTWSAEAPDNANVYQANKYTQQQQRW